MPTTTHTTTPAATLGAYPVQFTPTHRQDDPAPTVTTLTATIELTYEDLVAALYAWNAEDPAEFTDDHYVRYLVTSAALDLGACTLADTKHTITRIQPGTPEHTWLRVCHTTITRVFGTPLGQPSQPATAAPRSTAGRALVKVGA